VLVRPGRERLTGVVEVDETYLGGEEPGLRGGRARGKKLPVGIAVERLQPRGLGRCRMAVLPDATTPTPRAFLADHVEEGATVITDGWQAYRQATAGRYVRQRRPAAGREANTTLPGVHRIASLAKRWLLGTHQGSVDDAHLPSYLDEFVFRFNRRRLRSRGLVFYRVLELAIAHEPVRYRDLMLNPRPTRGPRQPPGSRGKPPTLDRPPARRPWRNADRGSSG
jgi:transposase-like protein